MEVRRRVYVDHLRLARRLECRVQGLRVGRSFV